MKRITLGWVAFFLICTAPRTSAALPMYAMRSARTCGNCHVSPTQEDEKGWQNPVWYKRKCTMSCVGCHVNPSGGGLRNVSGRYYGQSTLAMLPTQERSYSDHGRELMPRSLLAFVRRLASSPKKPDIPLPPKPPKEKKAAATSAPSSAPSAKSKTIPSDYAEVKAGIGAGARGGFSSFLKSLNGSPQGEYAFWDGRYGDLNADPMIVAGADLRFAYWSGTSTFFPMQIDLHGALHLMEHVTAMVTVAGRGRAGGPKATIDQDRFPVFTRNAFLMVHELPAMAYVKAGIFMPSFGTHIDDHTSFTRSFFEMDVSQSEDTVVGVEVGLAPNYPFLSFSAFRNFSPPDVPSGTDPGFGMALNLGWRDIVWHLTAHAMIKRRDLEARGDLSAIGVAWGLNPFALSNWLPVTYMGELTVGHAQRPGTGSQATVMGMVHELWVTIFNGFSLRGKYDMGTRDADLADSTEHRLSFMLDVGIIPGVTLIAGTRTALSGETAGDTDALIQAHLWF